jgi:hypothetical protein
MSEEVIIGGYSKEAIQALPEWAKEATQKQILQNSSSQSSNVAKLVQILTASVAKEGITNTELRRVIRELSKIDSAITKSASDIVDAQQDTTSTVSEGFKEQNKQFYGLVSAISNLSNDLKSIQMDMVQGIEQTSANFTKILENNSEVIDYLKESADTFDDIRTILDNMESITPEDIAGLTSSIEGIVPGLRESLSGLSGAVGDLANQSANDMANEDSRSVELIRNAADDVGELAETLGRAAGSVAGGAAAGAPGALAGGFLGGEAAEAAAELGVKLAAATVALSSWTFTVLDERYEFASEMRQTGLLAGLNISFTDLAVQVNELGFSMGEAAGFARKFSQTIGVYGVQESLSFVNQLAYQEDYIGRYGLKFGQIINLAGEYLSTQQALGDLATLSDADRDRGMRSFMRAVESTALTLNVSMEEAAEMMRSAIDDRPDIAAMMAVSDIDPAIQAQILQMTQMFGPLGDMLAVGAINPGQFQLTEQFAEMMGTPALQPIIPIMEDIQRGLASGKTAGELSQMYGQQISDLVQSDALNQQLAFMDQETQQIIAGLARFAGLSMDSGGEIRPTDEGSAMADLQEEQRQLALSMEQSGSIIAQSIPQLTTHLQFHTTALDKLGTQIVTLGESIGPAGGQLLGAAMDISSEAINLAAGTVHLVADVVDVGFNNSFFEEVFNYLGDSIRDTRDTRSQEDISAQITTGVGSSLGIDEVTGIQGMSPDQFNSMIDSTAAQLSEGAEEYSGWLNNAFWRNQNVYIEQAQEMLGVLQASGLGADNSFGMEEVIAMASSQIGNMRGGTGGYFEGGMSDKEINALGEILEGARASGAMSEAAAAQIATALENQNSAERTQLANMGMSDDQFALLISALRGIQNNTSGFN